MKHAIFAGLLVLTGLFPCAIGAATPTPSAAGRLEFQGCHVRWDERELVVANTHFERTWRIKDGLLTATSFRDLDAKLEWIAQPADRPAPCPGTPLAKQPRGLVGVTHTGRQRTVEAESLVLDLTSPGEPALAYRLQVFPASRGVTMEFTADVSPSAAAPQEAAPKLATPSGIETNPAKASDAQYGDSLEDILLAPQHLRFTQVTLRDQTDNHNELVFETEWLLGPNEAPMQLAGNVFFVENPLTGAGLLFLKQAPLPHARPEKSDWDAQMLPGPRRLRFAGQGYPFVLLSYAGGRTGRIEALQTYQRQLRAYDPARDGMFLSNTWGDRSRDARINEAFLLQEIEAGARLGVDVVQIDDGWQKGRSANSATAGGVWNGYWAADSNFWQPDAKRFPGGLAPVVNAARSHGMKFGLWFGPDSSQDATNWQRDANRLLELHRADGIDYFKLDSMKAVTTGTARNLRRFWDRVQGESSGRVVFDLDVTAEIRPGYFGAPDVGPVFVENRYTDFHRYWPHQTLRNLWKLSQYVDPLRLRMEFLNNTRNADKYSDDPLAPSCYAPDYLFASVMFANPLGWFEVSHLPPDYITSVSKLVTVWKRERAQLFAGTLLPIGNAPDGASWTGFASVAEDRRQGYVLVFRERTAAATWSVDVPLLATPAKQVTVLAGTGTAAWKDGRLSVNIPDQLQYLFLKLAP